MDGHASTATIERYTAVDDAEIRAANGGNGRRLTFVSAGVDIAATALGL
jgi:hypothetical protein